MPTKEQAIKLIGELEEMARKTEAEIVQLKFQINPRCSFKPAGKSALEFHLGVLKELITNL